MTNVRCCLSWRYHAVAMMKMLMENTICTTKSRALSFDRKWRPLLLLPSQYLPVHWELFHLIFYKQGLHAALEVVICEATTPVEEGGQKGTMISQGAFTELSTVHQSLYKNQRQIIKVMHTKIQKQSCSFSATIPACVSLRRALQHFLCPCPRDVCGYLCVKCLVLVALCTTDDSDTSS